MTDKMDSIHHFANFIEAIWNNITEKGDPCSIPFSRETIRDRWPLTSILKLLFDKKHLTKLNIIEQYFRTFKTTWVTILSNPFSKSLITCLCGIMRYHNLCLVLKVFIF